MLRLFAALLALTLVTACGGTQLLNTLSTNSGEVKRNVAYGTLPRQKLDVYSPKVITAETPTLVFYHGGSWQFGSKDDYRFLGAAFAARGIQTVVVNYRLHPEVIFPAFIEDAAKALVFTNRTIAQNRPVFLAGHSAGAHIAAMVALDPRFLRAESSSICDAVEGIIGVAGPYDFTPVEPAFKRIFPIEILPSTKPLNFATTLTPPILLLHGTKDTTVLSARTTDMARALTEAGNRVQTKLYDDVDHIYIIGAVSPIVRRAAPTLADIVTFIGEQKTAGYPSCERR